MNQLVSNQDRVTMKMRLTLACLRRGILNSMYVYMSGTWIAEMSVITCLGFILYMCNPVLYSHTYIHVPTEIMLETTHAQKHILSNSMICHFWCVVGFRTYTTIMYLNFLVTFKPFW